jgi:hypothetical protein
LNRSFCGKLQTRTDLTQKEPRSKQPAPSFTT